MPLRLWNKDEMILALDLYFKLPFGRLNHSTPEVEELALLIGRTSNSVAFRLTNYAACDPYILATGRKGMEGGRKVCLPYWNEYAGDKERLFYEAAQIRSKMRKQTLESELSLTENDFVGKEREAVIKQRVNQSAFRDMVLANYNQRCAVTGIDIPKLLIASHIIPWADDPDQRLNPANGICLSALYDRAFDKGLITIKPDFRILLSSELEKHEKEPYFEKHFASVANQKIQLPEEHIPDTTFLEYHFKHIFLGRD